MRKIAERAVVSHRQRHLASFYGGAGYPRDLDETTESFPTVDEAALVLRYASASGGVIVDLGCGFGRHLSALRSLSGFHQRLVGVDIVLDCCARAQRWAPVVCADQTQLPFAARSVGLVFSYFTSIGFWGEEGGIVLQEIARVLRPGGHLVLQVALAHGQWRRPIRIRRERGHGHALVVVETALPIRGGYRINVAGWSAQQFRPRVYRLRYSLMRENAWLRAAEGAGLRLCDEYAFARPVDSKARTTWIFERSDD